MATDMTSALRAFAFKTLEEAKQRGASLATVQAATATLADVTAASLSKISSNVPTTSTALNVFRVPQQQQQQAQSEQQQSQDGYDPNAALSRRLRQLEGANEAARAAVAGGAAQALGESVYKMDLVNESLAFTIENIQECAHVMSLLNRQLKDSAAMQTPAHKDFYRRPADASSNVDVEEQAE